MHLVARFFVVVAALLPVFITASPIEASKREVTYAGYLISTFSDASPKVEQYLSNGNSATKFVRLNKGNPILTSTVGTKAVRDVFLASNSARTQFYLIATGMTCALSRSSSSYTDPKNRSRHQRVRLFLGQSYPSRQPRNCSMEIEQPDRLVSFEPSHVS